MKFNVGDKVKLNCVHPMFETNHRTYTIFQITTNFYILEELKRYEFEEYELKLLTKLDRVLE